MAPHLLHLITSFRKPDNAVLEGKLFSMGPYTFKGCSDKSLSPWDPLFCFLFVTHTILKSEISFWKLQTDFLASKHINDSLSTTGFLLKYEFSFLAVDAKL